MISKKDAAWLLVRSAGIAFGSGVLWHACAAAFDVYLMAGPFEDSGHVYAFARQGAVIEIIVALGYGILCVYFLRRGTMAHQFLMHEGPNQSTQPPQAPGPRG